MQACYFAGDYASATAAKANAEEILEAAQTFIDFAEYHFYGALILAGSHEKRSAEKRQGDVDGSEHTIVRFQLGQTIAPRTLVPAQP
jgi:hypothetical protein